MAGLDRDTGKLLDGFPHVVQSIDIIVTTQLASRGMRRHFGAALFTLLGKLLTADLIPVFFAAYALAVEIWEPRFRITRIIPRAIGVEHVRLGRLAFAVEGEYRPRAHLGDLTPEGVRRISYGQDKDGRLFGRAA